MNVQNFLTLLVEAITVSFVALLMLDLSDRLTKELLNIVWPVPTTPEKVTDYDSNPVPPHLQQVVEFEGFRHLKCNNPQPQTFQALLVEDPWSAEVELATKTCCCHTTALALGVGLSHIATPTPQLLLPPVQEVSKQPDFAVMPNSELRKLCQMEGIKWRNAHGQHKHLNKPEMIAALCR